MKVEIGEYLRLNNGYIYQWESNDYEWINEEDGQLVYGNGANEYEWESDIIKHSLNIIDLIEDKDLIKIEYKLATGQKQQEILEVIKNREEKLFVNSWIRKMFIEEFKNFDIEIKSIITHEQIESMEYKVKE